MGIIISKTPFRVSFCGGGTDFSDFFLHNPGGGQVISTTINKYVYITITEKFDRKIHLRYSQTECVDNVDDIQHDLFRECLKMTKIDRGIELTSISDIPSKGSGLGSSSAFTVGLLKAMYAFKGYDIPPYELAKRAANIEIAQCGAKIGLQDQFASAYGGLNKIFFAPRIMRPDVIVSPLNAHCNYQKLKWLEESTLLFYLGTGRKASSILEKHNSRIINKQSLFNENVELVDKFEEWLDNDNKEISNKIAGDFINRGWEIKKAITPEATDIAIDGFIEHTLDLGAYGAKVCGAGNGGFLMVICDPDRQHLIRKEIGLNELKFSFSSCGSQIIYNGRCRL